MRKITDTILLTVMILCLVPGMTLSAIATILFELVSPWGLQAVSKIEKFFYD